MLDVYEQTRRLLNNAYRRELAKVGGTMVTSLDINIYTTSGGMIENIWEEVSDVVDRLGRLR